MKSRISHSAVLLALLAPLAAWAQVSVSINIGPPPLLAYAQPMVPGEGYIWTPGYWGWSRHDRGYYWIPGTWVLAPTPGYLWTPGYWAFGNSGYLWNQGYWGPSVGFYGGINYGYGYGGRGYDGGRWNGDVFSYNRAYNNISPTIVRNIYTTRSIGSNYQPANSSNVSFNGGRGGVNLRPTAAQVQVQRAATRTEAVPMQVEHERASLGNPSQRASTARSAPVIAATPKPSAFTEAGVVRSRGERGDRGDRSDRRDAQPAAAPVQREPVARAPAEQRPAPQQQAPEGRGRPEPRSDQQMGNRAAPQERAAQPQQQHNPQPKGERGQGRSQDDDINKGRDKDRKRD